MTDAGGSHSHGHGWYSGPRGWVVSAVLGIVAGVVLSMVMPAGTASESGAHEYGVGETIVVQIGADGERVRRMADGTTVAWGKHIGDSVLSDAPEGSTGAPPTPVPQNAEEGSAGTPLPRNTEGHGGGVELWMVVPFVLLLACIALMPFVNERWWHARYPDVALFLGAMMTAYYLCAFGGVAGDGGWGRGGHAMLHAGIEYYSFIALIGGLYVVSGGVFVNIRSEGTPWRNTLLLAAGAVMANVVGTTGASMLLIRPFMRMNAGRLHALHVVMFIFIVSNCGGCLTPIGDPPLYLGFLKGVPFEWTLLHLWPMWAVCVGVLLGVFYVIDIKLGGRGHEVELQPTGVPETGWGLIRGWPSVGMLALLVGAVFIDPMIKSRGLFGGVLEGVPVGATVQLAVAAAAFMMTPKWIHAANGFSFGPVKEVGFLFIGIFATMVPALEYLAANGSALGLETPTQFYFGTGSLSGVLDNAPTYLNFMQTGFGVLHLPLSEAGIHEFIGSSYEVTHPLPDGTMVHYEGQQLLEAISLGAVFFGAMTYIGNGPNFMVKAIAESSGVKMPSFFGYLLLAMMILLPVLVGVWAVFIAEFAMLG